MSVVVCSACRQSNSDFDLVCSACGTALPLVSSEPPRLAGKTAENSGPRLDQEPEADPLLGREVSHFRIVAPLGRGGMGVVYRAVDLELGRKVAIKFLSPSSGLGAREEERFRREARATAALDHPNIGTVYEVGEHQGRRFIAMAFHDGETLAERLEKTPSRQLEVAETASVAGQLAAALAAAHDAGIVHRDLKPANVMRLPDGRIKLLDFGLARTSDPLGLTERGLAVGTAAYMPPESFGGGDDGEATGGPAADLWALGVLLYEMLAGHRPFGGERQGMVHNILHEQPPPLAAIRPDLPLALDRVIGRCLAKKSSERPANAREILRELAQGGLWESTAGETVGAISSGSANATLRATRWLRNRGKILLALFLFMVLLAIGLYWRGHAASPPIYVAVLEPTVTGAGPPAEQAFVAGNLQAAILRSLAGLVGVAAIEPAQVKAVSGSTPEIARAVAAGEVVAGEASCADDLCQVRLRRMSGADGRVLWTTMLQLPSSQPRLFAEAVTAAIRQGYPDHSPRFPNAELAIDEAAYGRYLALRQQLSGGQNLDQVLRDLAELRAQAPRMIEVYSLEATVARRRFAESGERRYLNLGLEVARRARELAPADPRPLANLFELELQAGNLDEAQRMLEAFAAIDPAAALLRRGQLAERRGDDHQAIELMTAAARIQPSWRTLLILANAEYRLGRLAAARGHLGELLERSPGNVEGLRTLAQIELLNDPERAVVLLEELVARRPDAGSLTNLGMAWMLLRRLGDAETSFRRALALEPHSPSAGLNLADCLLLLGRETEARELYRGLLDSTERETTLGNWPMLSIEAQARAHLGETDQAIEAIQEALRLTPDNAQLALEAAVVYMVIGDRGSALFHARRATAQGLDARWLAFPWFDPLRNEPSFPTYVLKEPVD